MREVILKHCGQIDYVGHNGGVWCGTLVALDNREEFSFYGSTEREVYDKATQWMMQNNYKYIGLQQVLIEEDCKLVLEQGYTEEQTSIIYKDNLYVGIAEHKPDAKDLSELTFIVKYGVLNEARK